MLAFVVSTQSAATILSPLRGPSPHSAVQYQRCESTLTNTPPPFPTLRESTLCFASAASHCDIYSPGDAHPIQASENGRLSPTTYGAVHRRNNVQILPLRIPGVPRSDLLKRPRSLVSTHPMFSTQQHVILSYSHVLLTTPMMSAGPMNGPRVIVSSRVDVGKRRARVCPPPSF